MGKLKRPNQAFLFRSSSVRRVCGFYLFVQKRIIRHLPKSPYCVIFRDDDNTNDEEGETTNYLFL
jgi:hypothetical protein